MGKCRRHFRHGKRRRASNPCSTSRIKRYMRRCDVRCCEINPASVSVSKNRFYRTWSFSSYEVDNRGIVVRCRVGGNRFFPFSSTLLRDPKKTLTGALSFGLMQPVRGADHFRLLPRLTMGRALVPFFRMCL